MKRHRFKILSAALATAALAASGCVSTPDRPEQQLARAETSIEFAEQNGARDYGPTALERARNHLATARREADDGEYADALRAAQKAELDAELAAAQTSTRKAEEALEEINDNIEALRREIARQEIS